MQRERKSCLIYSHLDLEAARGFIHVPDALDSTLPGHVSDAFLEKLENMGSGESGMAGLGKEVRRGGNEGRRGGAGMHEVGHRRVKVCGFAIRLNCHYLFPPRSIKSTDSEGR